MRHSYNDDLTNSGVVDRSRETCTTTSSRRISVRIDDKTLSRQPHIGNDNHHQRTRILVKNTTTTLKIVPRLMFISRWSWLSSLFLALCCVCSTFLVEAVSLLNGRYETTTDVMDYLNLALDAADMKETDDFATKKNIYQNVRQQRCDPREKLLHYR
jgi:hypothetical protein